MRRRILSLAIFAASAAWPAHAQDGRWGDSGAAVFNSPMGYGSQAEFNGSPKGSTRDAKGNRTIVNGRFTDNCYYSVDGITPGVGSRSRADQTGGFPQNPCAGNGGGTPVQNNQAIGNNLTVVTTGAWNTVVVDSKQQNNGNQSATLNGGLHLD